MSVLKVYNPIDLEIDHGDGVYVYSEDGTRYLDFTSGIGVLSLGYSHPALIQALKDQADKIWHCSNLFKIEKQNVVAEKIVKNSFASSVFFCNSGAEATETSIKVARKYFFDKGKKNKNKIITFQGAFHGRTLASLYAANNKTHIEGFGPKVEGFINIPFGDHDALKNAVDKNTAAIMVETILGEGGIKVIPLDCLNGLRKICDENDTLLILDEVQCGVGRTGKFFAFEWSDIEPDIVPIAKGIGGGFPIGACLLNKKVTSCMGMGTHGSTFGGNPLAMSVANVVLDHVLKKDFLDHVQSTGKYLKDLLESEVLAKYKDFILEIRGQGLMLGIKSKIKNDLIIEKMRSEKLLTVKASDNVIRLLPPLILQKSHVDEAIDKILKALLKL
ncbi:MAG: aspartate aminotransferase family protein [Alphaproteobacteria bacterium]